MRQLLISAMALTMAATLASCDRSGETTSTTTTPPAPTSTESPAPGTQPVADTQPATSSASNLPGLPTIKGASVRGLSTADAAATRLIDAAKEDLSKNSVSTARTLLGELKQKGMYDSLSAPVKSRVDQLEIDINNAGPTTQSLTTQSQ